MIDSQSYRGLGALSLVIGLVPAKRGALHDVVASQYTTTLRSRLAMLISTALQPRKRLWRYTAY